MTPTQLEQSFRVKKIDQHRNLREWLKTVDEDMKNVSLTNRLCLENILVKAGWMRNSDNSWSKKAAKVYDGKLVRFDKTPAYQHVKMFTALTYESLLQEKQLRTEHLREVARCD